MKMLKLKEFTVVLFCLSLFSALIEANTGESVQIKFYNRDFNVPASQMREMLKKADLEGHGYLKEVTTKTVKKPDKPEYLEKSYYYYKIVNCSKVSEIEQGVDNLRLSGVFGSGLAEKLFKEMGVRHLGKPRQCKTGVEIVFDYGAKKAVPKRQKRGWGRKTKSKSKTKTKRKKKTKQK